LDAPGAEEEEDDDDARASETAIEKSTQGVQYRRRMA
jgi:hypothetical protein